jgi:tRNA pseudouridine38-40 synthase
MAHRNIKMILAYDGSRYQGWQRQKAGETIQQSVEEKLRMILQEPVCVIASGRTDAGVHALNQVCHFRTGSRLGVDVIRKGLNALLPEDIFVREISQVDPDFHARYSAKGKVYEYRILNRDDRDPFQRHYAWHVRTPLDVARMSECLSTLEGTHDFSSFRSSGSGNTNPVRTICRAEIGRREGGLLSLVLEADGFLRHMVRNIVGTVVEVGLGRIDPSGFEAILGARDRRRASSKAPPQGLFLVQVRYDHADLIARL